MTNKLMQFEDLKVGMKVKFKVDWQYSIWKIIEIKDLRTSHIDMSDRLKLQSENGMKRQYFNYDDKRRCQDLIDWETTTKLNQSQLTESAPSIVSKVIINKPVIIIFFRDGTKQVAKCDTEDIFDIEKGIMVCLSKKLLGNYEKLDKVLEMGSEITQNKSRVELLNNLYCYPNYDWFVYHSTISDKQLKRCIEGYLPYNGTIGNIIYEASHPKIVNKMLCVVEEANGKIFIVDKIGLKFL